MESVKGLKKLITVLEKLPKEMDAAVDAEVQGAGFYMKEQAQKNIQKNGSIDQGALFKSQTYVNAGNKTARVFSNGTGLAPYDVFIEYGTAPHIIKPKNKSVLRFEVGGEVVFSKEVKHPGTPPRPFFYPAYLDTKKFLIKNLENLLDKKFNKI